MGSSRVRAGFDCSRHPAGQERRAVQITACHDNPAAVLLSGKVFVPVQPFPHVLGLAFFFAEARVENMTFFSL